MRPGLGPLLSRGHLVLLLLAGVLLGLAPQVWAALALLVLQAAALYRSPPPHLDLVLTLVTLLLAPMCLVPLIGPIPAALLVLPALLLPDIQLRQLARELDPPAFHRGMHTTRILNTLAISLGAIIILAIATGATDLLVTSALLLAALAARFAQEVYALRASPFRLQPKRLRVLAGSQGRVTMEVRNDAPFPLRAVVSSPQPWLALRPETLHLESGGRASLEITAAPRLAGPGSPDIRAVTAGPWGLVAAGYSTAPLELHVVPRARYAAWLARRYLEATGQQGGEIATQVVRPLPRRMSGIEYHRLREYEPGDQLRDIEWRHTLKLRELIVKERLDTPAGSAVLLVNLAVASEEEADWLAYHLVTSALSAAHQGVRVSILAYNEWDVVLDMEPRDGREALKEALRLSTRLAYVAPIERLLAPPDVLRLRRAVRRLEADGATLAALLRIELAELEQLARYHPVAALAGSLIQRRQQGSVITVISHWNHDAEALAVALSWLRRRGYRVVDLHAEEAPAGAPRPL